MCDYVIVRVHFRNGDSTVLPVLDDDNIQDAIVALCEKEGWDPLTVCDYAIEEN